MRVQGARPRGSWLWVGLSTTALVVKAFPRVRMGWLVPLVLLLLVLAAALALLGAAGPLAPFIYPLL